MLHRYCISFVDDLGDSRTIYGQGEYLSRDQAREEAMLFAEKHAIESGTICVIPAKAKDLAPYPSQVH